MAYEQRDNSGSLFKNDKKTEDKHPDYKGEALINGTSMWISAWIKEGKTGKFMSLSFNPKDGGNGNRQQSKPKPTEDKDVPF
jgi:hypothetical protein